MSYVSAAKHIPDAKRLGVSTVARSSGGFMGNYKRAGSSSKMNKRPLGRNTVGGKTWGQKREAFIKRHLAQYRKIKQKDGGMHWLCGHTGQAQSHPVKRKVINQRKQDVPRERNAPVQHVGRLYI